MIIKKNTEIWLAKSIFDHNFRTKFFSHMQFLQNAKGQASAYEMCDHTRTPLHTPKTLEMYKKKHVLFDSKSFKVCGRLHV